jgi:calcineurin-like phosphoesterase
VSCVAGTHTHVPTADARILPQKTAYITDVGMCGDYNSILGFETEAPINRLRRHYSDDRLTPAKGNGTLYGIVVETDDSTGLAKSITQIKCD